MRLSSIILFYSGDEMISNITCNVCDILFDFSDKVSSDGDDEMIIRLRFEPRGRPSGERDYYRSRKENICVVCGADKSFIRKNIIPREYRK